MTTEKTDAENREKVWDLIKEIRFCQLVTHDAQKRLRARPMAAVSRDFETGILWFMSRKQSPKNHDVARDGDVLLTYSRPDKQSYVAINGRAELVDDRAKIHELWSEPARIWFPKGEEDPDIELIKVTVDSAEYWDSPSSSFVYLYGYALSRLTGEAPNVGENEKVEFQTAV